MLTMMVFLLKALKNWHLPVLRNVRFTVTDMTGTLIMTKSITMRRKPALIRFQATKWHCTIIRSSLLTMTSYWPSTAVICKSRMATDGLRTDPYLPSVILKLLFQTGSIVKTQHCTTNWQLTTYVNAVFCSAKDSILYVKKRHIMRRQPANDTGCDGRTDCRVQGIFACFTPHGLWFYT